MLLTQSWSQYVLLLMKNITEAVVQRSSVRKVFLRNSLNSQETACAKVSLLIKLQAWPFEKSLKTPFYRTPIVLQ